MIENELSLYQDVSVGIFYATFHPCFAAFDFYESRLYDDELRTRVRFRCHCEYGNRVDIPDQPW